MRAISAVAVNVFKESVRDRVPYNLALFAVLLIGASYLLGQLTAGPGRQDHQGSRSRRDHGLRPVHRHLHRHRPGVEGGGAAQHLCAARQADQPAAVHPREVRRAGADAGRQRRGDDAGALRRARVPDLRRSAAAARGVGRAGPRSAAAAGDWPDLRAADDHHGDRPVLLDLLLADARRRPHVRALRGRSLQRRSEELRPRDASRSRRSGWRAASTTSCRTSRPSTSRPRSSTACRSAPATSPRRSATDSPTSQGCWCCRC